jgi:hypothetical protein
MYNYDSINCLDLRSDIENDNIYDTYLIPQGAITNVADKQDKGTWAIDCCTSDGEVVQSYLYSSELEYNEDIIIINGVNVEQAQEFLKEQGYFTDNLWHIEDVKCNFKCTDEEAQEVLNDVLTNDYFFEQTNNTIADTAREKGLEEIEEEEEFNPEDN